MSLRSPSKHCLSLIAICLLLLGCISPGNKASNNASNKASNNASNKESNKASNKASKVATQRFTMDTTVGSYGVGREDRLILATINSESHKLLTDSTNPQLTSSNLPERYANLMNDWANQFGITRVADWPIPALGVNSLVFETDGVRSREEIIALLNDSPMVETAQAVQYFNLAQGRRYNDPYLSIQYAVRSMNIEYTHSFASGKKVRIAVIDTGVDVTNPEISGRATDFYNFVDSDQNQFKSDVHGTAVAGIIASTANNNVGIVGIAPGAELLPIKACWQMDTDNENGSCNSITLLKALDTAIQENVDVINLSLAGPRDPLLEQMVQAALDKNIIVVGAQVPGNQDTFPAAVQGTIAVVESGNKAVGVLKAPGQNILSLHPQKDFELYSGSSFSTAHVSGVAALIRELEPTWSTAEIESLLKVTSDLGSGSANACRAISFIVEADESICD